MRTVPTPGPARSALGRAYGEQLTRDRPGGDPLTGIRATAGLAEAYRHHFLGGPVFLTETERRTQVRDVRMVYDLLRSVPERIFQGDLVALARSVGMNPTQTELVVRSARTGPLLPLGRADLYHDGTRFALLELNVSSALGGFENADINTAMLVYPPLREFVERHGLRYRDTVDAMVRTIRAEGAATLPAGRTPTVAVVDTEENFRIVGPRLRSLAGKLCGYGVDGLACHLGELRYPRGRPTIGGRTIDAVLRYFLIEDMAEPAAVAQLEPLMAAVERGTVCLVSRLDADLYGNKGMLALLSDDRHRDRFDASELALLDRFLPWTRLARARVTDVAGVEVDLLAYAQAHRSDLVLKPTLLHGGAGIAAGWRTDPAAWSALVAGAIDGPYVVQRRVRPAAELIPYGDGSRRPVYLNWGIYFADTGAVEPDGYAGCLVRGSADPDVGVVSMSDGALAGCAFDGG